MQANLERLKWAFYQWLGALSIEEVTRNSVLMDCAKRVESLLKKAKV